ncbi:hypothetical protein PLESTB_001347500 [Pleodorina starrii]|uniref:Uncharacterized protein n=1 Tax=Pleodorina starrii TaxID=330485 RepID=A0A9W6F6J0_9CHLO|nr:hypothetical protein PLESTM_000895900 [Pleodorina starrii]GLC58332.1 hypothetical protein PLESTB_001347500 [Pleodorina starrii]GLC69423.1 hypothetical protein PLESTF_000829200 [Pleodorina starrii]
MLLFRLSNFHVTMQTRHLARQLSSLEHARRYDTSRVLRQRAPAPAVRHLSSLRSTKGDRPGSESDKSWGEIIGDAAGVAKSVFNKIKDTATSLLPSTSGQQSAKPATTAKPEAPLGPSLGGGGGLLPNLIGRAVGGMVSSALSSLSKQLEEAAREQAGAYEEAVAKMQDSAKLRARLGTVTVGPVMSQSSSSSSINGVVTRQVALMMPVYGSLGVSGTAQVTVVQGPQQQTQTMQISVRTSDGAVVQVDDGGRGPGGGRSGRGQVIDVEFREVDK